MDAMISARTGLALIVSGERLASIHAAEPEQVIPRHPSELHFLIGEARDFVAVENLSRVEIVRRLLLAQDPENALQLSLILLDPDLTEDIRLEAVEELEALLGNEEIVHYLDGLFFAKRLPEEADPEGGLRLAKRAEAQNVLSLLRKLQAGLPPTQALRNTDGVGNDPRQERPDLWAAIQEFRNNTDLEDLDIEQAYSGIRDRSPGREPEL